MSLLVVGATNRAHAALRRPGRMNREIVMMGYPVATKSFWPRVLSSKRNLHDRATVSKGKAMGSSWWRRPSLREGELLSDSDPVWARYTYEDEPRQSTEVSRTPVLATLPIPKGVGIWARAAGSGGERGPGPSRPTGTGIMGTSPGLRGAPLMRITHKLV
jgi:hypothetical protein